MAITYRRATVDEMAEVMHARQVAFGGSTAVGLVRRRVERSLVYPAERLCAYDGGDPIAQLVIVPTEMRWNRRTIAASGVTDVFTIPSHRRRGILRELMRRAFSDMRDAGQAVTILEASMAAIYQRFGWAVAYTGLACDVDPRNLHFVAEIPVAGQVRLVTAEQARPVIAEAYQRFIEPRTLPLVRSDREWTYALWSLEAEATPLLVAVYEEGNEALGYSIYGIGQHGERRAGAGQRLTVQELVWNNPAAHRALMQYLASYDLVDSVVIFGMPLDDPLFQQVEEPRLLHLRAYDGALARIVEVERALAARGYDGVGRVVLNVVDEDAPWNTGIWELEAEQGAGLVKRTSAEPQLHLTPRALCLLVSGTWSATTLARNGLLSCTDSRVLPLADTIFRTERVPVCLDHWM